jgi:hypothetical protein
MDEPASPIDRISFTVNRRAVSVTALEDNRIIRAVQRAAEHQREMSS